jgi:hypothetical protein
MIRQTLQKTLPIIQVTGPTSTGAEELLLAKSILYVAEISEVTPDLADGEIKLQGSLDNANWIDLDLSAVTANGILALKDTDGQFRFYRIRMNCSAGSFQVELTLLAKRGYN